MDTRLVIKVLKNDKLIDRFDYALKLGEKISLPDKTPYDGLSFFFSVDSNGGFQFMPDASEMFIHFSNKRFGVSIEWLHDEKYKLLFRTYNGERQKELDEKIDRIKALNQTLYKEDESDEDNVNRLNSLSEQDEVTKEFIELLRKRNSF